VDAHAGPFRALAIARIGDLPEQGHHAQLLQENGVEGHLIQTVRNLGGGARHAFALDRVDRYDNGVLRFALPDESRERGIAGIAAVPVGLAVDLDGLEHGGQTGRGEQNVRRNGVVLKNFTAARPHIGGGDEEVDWRFRKPLEIDEFGQNLAQRIDALRIQIVGRKQTGHEIDGDIGGRKIHRPTAKKHICGTALDWAEAPRLGDAAPEIL